MIPDRVIDTALTRGSGFQGGKQRILEYFNAVRSERDRAVFLKDEYGIGGGGFLGFNIDYDSKGIRIRLGRYGVNEVEESLSWTEAAKRIGALIDNGEYDGSAIPPYNYLRLVAAIYS